MKRQLFQTLLVILLPILIGFGCQNDPIIPTEKVDILNYDLDFDFNFNQKSFTVNEKITFAPTISDEIKLDGIGLDVLSVEINDKVTENYKVTSTHLVLPFQEEMATDFFTINILFKNTEKWNEGVDKRDQGLYFIDHDESNPNLSSQIWTQFEPVGARRSFFGIDSTAEKSTYEITLRTPSHFDNFCIGNKIAEDIIDDKKVSTFKFNDPISTYHVAWVSGDNFIVIEDEVDGIKMEHIVEKEYAEHAEYIFGISKRAIQILIKKYGKYAFGKYPFRSISRQNDPTGAMEHPSLIGYNAYHQILPLEDYHYYWLTIAHEIGHQKFGNQFTCTHYGEASLQEGFATKFELDFIGEVYGPYEREYESWNQPRRYLSAFRADSNSTRAIVVEQNYENNPEKLFDEELYEKPGWLLQKWEEYLSEDLFTEWTRKFLEKNTWKNVTFQQFFDHFNPLNGTVLFHQLNPHEFVNQWLYQEGHGVFEFEFSQQGNEVTLAVSPTQIQDWKPFGYWAHKIAIFSTTPDGRVIKSNQRIDIEQTFDQQFYRFQIPEGDSLSHITMNYGQDDLGEWWGKKAKNGTYQQAVNEYWGSEYTDIWPKLLALRFIIDENPNTQDAQEIFQDAIRHKFWRIRGSAIQGVKDQEILKDFVLNPDNVRGVGLAILNIEDKEFLLELYNDSSKPFLTRGWALNKIYEIDKDLGIQLCLEVGKMNPHPHDLSDFAIEILSATGDYTYANQMSTWLNSSRPWVRDYLGDGFEEYGEKYPSFLDDWAAAMSASDWEKFLKDKRFSKYWKSAKKNR